MTVTSQTRTALIACDGITTSWPLAWGFDHPKDLVAELVDAAGARVPLAWPADFDAVRADNESGTFTTSTTHPAGFSIVVSRRTVPVQERSISSKARLDLEGVERAVDRLTMARIDDTGRVLRIPDGEAGTIAALPSREARANRQLGFDGDGNPVVGSDVVVGVVELHDLVDDGVTEQGPQLKAAIDAATAGGAREFRLAGKIDGSSAIRIGRRLVFDALPPSVTFSRVRFVVDAAARGGFYIRGRERELPATGKARLWADVDVSGGPVATFDIDVSPNPAIVALLVPQALVGVRGRNGAEGEVLDGHYHEAQVVSLTQVAGNRYTLVLSAGLPNTTGTGAWSVAWAGSDWNPANGGPASDDTLISVVAAAFATENLTDSRIMAIAEGRAAALGLAEGVWVEVLDDAKGADYHGTSTEPLNRQMVRIAGVVPGDGDDDVVTFDDVIRGSLLVAKRARLVVIDRVQPFSFEGPGAAFPVRFVGTPAAAPASRGHFIETRYCERAVIEGWHHVHEPDQGYLRGAFLRNTTSWRTVWRRCEWRGPVDFAPAFNAGDCYGLWDKGSADTLVEHCVATGGRHGAVLANFVDAVVRFCEFGRSGFQCLDLHGEGGHGADVHHNKVVRGPAWPDRPRHIGIQVGNQAHTFGDRDVCVRDNAVEGFDGADDLRYLVVSGCDGVDVSPGRIEGAGAAVSVQADHRAPGVAISNITIAGSFNGCGIVVDGRMPAWAPATLFEGSASRPTYCEVDGLLWSTTATGTSGGDAPDPGESPVAGTTTSSDGTLTWTYQGAVQRPISDVSISARIIGAATPLTLARIDGLTVSETLIDGSAGMSMTDCPAALIRNLEARIDADGDWLVDGGDNDGTRLDGIEAGASAIDEAGGSTFVVRGASTEIPAGSNALVGRDGDGAVALRTLEAASLEVVGSELRAKGVLSLADELLTAATTARELADAERTSGDESRAGKIRALPVNFASAGRLDVPEDAPRGWVWHLIIDPSSDVVTIGVTGDAGSVNGSSGGTAELIAGTEAIVRVTANAGTAPTVRVIGAKGGKTIYGDLVAGNPPSGLRNAISGFNSLVPVLAEVTASFTWAAGEGGGVKPCNHASVAIVGTVPPNGDVAYPIGTLLSQIKVAAAAVSFAPGSGVTITEITGKTAAAREVGSMIGVLKVSTDGWRCIGDYADE